MIDNEKTRANGNKKVTTSQQLIPYFIANK
jgi:hypothetical protein